MIGLQETLIKTPYNSFGKIILSEGGSYQESYGGNCVFQCRRLTSALISSTLDLSAISYATATEKPHWVLFVRDGDEYMLDPFLLCPEPINISRVKRGETQVLDAYPKWVKKVEAKLLDDGRIQVALFTKKTSSFNQVLTYTYDLSVPNKNELPPDNYQLLAWLCQKNLEMGILVHTEWDGEVVRIYRQPGQQNMGIRFIWGQHYSHNHSDFRSKVREIAFRLWYDEGEFMQIWNKGETLYLEKQVEICELRDSQQS